MAEKGKETFYGQEPQIAEADQHLVSSLQHHDAL